MVLDLECVRAVMIYVETNQVYETIEVDGFPPIRRLKQIPVASMMKSDSLLGGFTADTIEYSCSQAIESGLLSAQTFSKGFIVIDDITPEGHKFLAALRNDSVWASVKSSIKHLGSVSLPIVVKLGADIMMKHFFP